MWSACAGIAAATAMAVLPIEVITARSDTMDAVMMLVLVLALWLAVRAVESGRLAFLLAAAAALGVAFDVKLLESLVALPGLAVFAYLGMSGARVRRLVSLLAASAVYIVVALAWLTATLLFPAHDRPYAIGSTNGSAWNAAFVFNGSDRLGGKSPEPGQTVYEAGHRYPTATQAQRDHIPIVPPSPTRLLARIGPLSGERLGLEALVALLLGIPALAWGIRGEREEPPQESPAEPAADARRRRLRRAAAGGLSTWMLTGLVLYSHMVRLHPRYVEAFTPAVAAMLGIGLAWATAPATTLVGERAQALSQRLPAAWERMRLPALLVTLAVVVYYSERLLYGVKPVWWLTLVAAVLAGALALFAGTSRGIPALGPAWKAAGVTALALVAILAVPLKADFTAIADRISDAGLVGQIPGVEQHPLSAYLRAHQGGAYYEVAAESATAVGSLIVQDARPILMLTTYDARVYTTVPELRRLIAKGKVRYAFLNTFCSKRAASVNPACSTPVQWVRAHGTDVSREAGLRRDGVLYLLPGASA